MSQRLMESLVRSIFFFSSILFASSVILYSSYNLDSIPIVRTASGFVESSMPFIPVFSSIAGIMAGFLGVISLIVHFTARFKGWSLNSSATIIYLPLIYGIITVVYIVIAAGIER